MLKIHLEFLKTLVFKCIIRLVDMKFDDLTKPILLKH
jgi:hypothetical protein